MTIIVDMKSHGHQMSTVATLELLFFTANLPMCNSNANDTIMHGDLQYCRLPIPQKSTIMWSCCVMSTTQWNVFICTNSSNLSVKYITLFIN